MIEFKDWATFDTPDEYWEKVNNQILGSLEKARETAISREEMRSLKGSKGAVELIFK